MTATFENIRTKTSDWFIALAAPTYFKLFARFSLATNKSEF